MINAKGIHCNDASEDKALYEEMLHLIFLDQEFFKETVKLRGSSNTFAEKIEQC